MNWDKPETIITWQRSGLWALTKPQKLTHERRIVQVHIMRPNTHPQPMWKNQHPFTSPRHQLQVNNELRYAWSRYHDKEINFVLYSISKARSWEEDCPRRPNMNQQFFYQILEWNMPERSGELSNIGAEYELEGNIYRGLIQVA